MESGTPEEYFTWRRAQEAPAYEVQSYETQLLDPLPPDVQRMALNLSIIAFGLGLLAVGLIVGYALNKK